MEVIPATVRLTTYDSGAIRSPADAFQSFIRSIEAGAVQLPIGKVMPLSEISAAHQLMEENQAGGKIVVTA
ncbi:MAG: zinc-binding dehydrogenase [Bacteroidia bacterium]|nr:zinc-binding dehydrogenase [Bacteroidia bacterium]